MNAAKELSAQIAADPELAWAWFCNIAMPITDTIKCSHRQANEAAAFLMFHLFDHDITTHPYYVDTGYGKTGAQLYAELRIAADREQSA